MNSPYRTLILLLLGGGVSITLTTGQILIADQDLSKTSPAKSLKGQEIVGMTLSSVDKQGQKQTLKINDVQIDPLDSAREIYLYTVLSQSKNGHWRNFCQSDSKGIAKAIPLSGRWDHSGTHIADGSITFACTNGALAKCVRWGYKPWKIVNGISLRNYHQACTRMVRADYCGDGRSHTQNGIPIDIYDRLGLNQRNPKSGMTFEAAWTTEGAIYLNRVRIPGAIVRLQKTCPEKLVPTSSQDTLVADDPEAALPQALLFNDSFVQS